MAKSAKAFVVPAEDEPELVSKAAPAPDAQPDSAAVAAAQPTPVTPPPPAVKATSEAKPLPSYRIGRRNLSAWIDEKAFRQFKSMAAEEGKTIQDYIVEVLNREFARKGRPQIAK